MKIGVYNSGHFDADPGLSFQFDEAPDPGLDRQGGITITSTE